MKIVYYCQHIWGVGHFFRSLEICRALTGHDIIMVTGGPEVSGTHLPSHVRLYRLPGLMTDRNYEGLFPTDRDRTLEDVKTERRQKLYRLLADEAPDAFVVELFPFGRRAFRFELDPVLEAMRDGRLRRGRVLCSLRDILVEKKDPASYEQRVVGILNRHFDALLVHADPALVKLDLTFSRLGDLTVPVVYTGFIAPKPAAGSRQRIRDRLGIGRESSLIVASAGGGQAGIVLLRPFLESLHYLDDERPVNVLVFTGPYMPEDEFEGLRRLADHRASVERFSSDFLALLAAADLSISMGGYNTSMNILACRVPALVWPYPGDREQGLRAARMSDVGAVTVLEENHLQPQRLAALIRRKLGGGKPTAYTVDLNGAENTARWIASLATGASP